MNDAARQAQGAVVRESGRCPHCGAILPIGSDGVPAAGVSPAGVAPAGVAPAGVAPAGDVPAGVSPGSTFATPTAIGSPQEISNPSAISRGGDAFGAIVPIAHATPQQAPPTEFRGYVPSTHHAFMSDRLAIVSILLGLISLPLFFAIVPAVAAIIIGALAGRRMRATHGSVSGMRTAMIGVVLGSIGLLIGIAWMVGRLAR